MNLRLTTPTLLLRSLKVSLVVGSLLVLINYSDRILNGELVASDYVRILMTYSVPFFVSLYGALSALSQSANDKTEVG